MTIKLLFAFSFSLASLISNPLVGLTQLTQQANADLPEPPDTGTPQAPSKPGTTRPGTTCQTKIQKPLTALHANNNSDFTLSEYPTFWFYVPYLPEEISNIEFLLLDGRERQTIYKTSLKLTQRPGIIKIKIPSKPEYALKSGENYRWYLQLDCKLNQTGEPDIGVNGWVQRKLITPELKGQLESLPSREYIAYREHGIWHDAINNLAELYAANPEDEELKDAWVKLLGSLEGLAKFAQEPFVNSELVLSED